MSRIQNFKHWREPIVPRISESFWRRRVLFNPVTTRSGFTTASPVELGSSSEEDQGTTVKSEPESVHDSEEEIDSMADNQEGDPEIGSLNVHEDGEPPQAIVVTPGQAAVDVKSHIIAVLPVYYGRSYGNPYKFLHEFCKIYKAQKRPTGSSEDDYRLKALPFALKGEADTWFMRLPPNSIRTWHDFKMAFLDQFFPATKTSALRKEIQGIIQE